MPTFPQRKKQATLLFKQFSETVFFTCPVQHLASRRILNAMCLFAETAKNDGSPTCFSGQQRALQDEQT